MAEKTHMGQRRDKISWTVEFFTVFRSIRRSYITKLIHLVYSYANACRNIFNTIKTSGHTSLEKYTSHFIERVVCERKLETEQRLQCIDPPHQLFWISQPFFPVLLGCSTEGMGAQPLLVHGSHSSIFSPTDLNFLSPGLYNNLLLFSLQQWVNTRKDWVLQLWRGSKSRRMKNSEFKTYWTPLKNWHCVISCPNGGVGKYGYYANSRWYCPCLCSSFFPTYVLLFIIGGSPRGVVVNVLKATF